jgi:drug/metabolite transporter (DMT)-like permease
VLASAFFWAFHVHAIGKFSRSSHSVKLAIVQYVFCGVVSLVVAFFVEPVELASVLDAALPIAYGGICSVGIGYTLQIVAQKSAPPSHAAIIMSLEGVFAVLGGFLILGEVLSIRGLAGCALMLCGMVVSQISVSKDTKVIDSAVGEGS